MELGNRGADRIAQDVVIGQPETCQSTRHRHRHIAHPAQDRAFNRGPVGQEIQGQQHQDNRHHFDRELRHRKIRGAQEHKPDRDHQPHNPHQD